MFSFASPSAIENDLSRSSIGLSCDTQRPLKMKARLIRDLPIFRFALRTLGQLIWSSDDGRLVLDPVITCHPDCLVFEGFSSDLSCYGRLSLDSQALEHLEEPTWGTTNVDFSSWLWSSLGELRSNRETILQLGCEGFGLNTLGHGGRFEKKVQLPSSWVRAFLELQCAMVAAYQGTRIDMDATSLIGPIRFLRKHKGRVSPRALRYEYDEGRQLWQMVLEPWERRFDLQIAGQSQRRRAGCIRVWGRQRLRFLEGLLPFAEQAWVHLVGRGRPHFYQVALPSMTFTLGLTGWGRQAFDSAAGLSLALGLLDDDSPERTTVLQQRQQHLAQKLITEFDPNDLWLARQGWSLSEISAVDGALRTRYRPLLAEPIDFPPDPRLLEARSLVVDLKHCDLEERTQSKKLGERQGQLLHRQWRMAATVAGVDGSNQASCSAVVGEREHIRFGRCSCQFFQENLMNQGPCSHLLALVRATAERRQDGPAFKGED